MPTRTCPRRRRRWAGSSAACYLPDPDRADAYDALYAEYRALHDHFGRGGNDVMHRLRAIRNAARDATAARRPDWR